MDAVKATVTGLNGSVEIKSEPGRGTSVILRLPLTLAIIRALLVKARDIYALPIEAVRENLYISPKDIKTINQEKVIVLRDEVIPLYSLRERLYNTPEDTKEVYPTVVMETGERKAAFLVDGFLGQQEIVIKSLHSLVRGIREIAGATVLGDGKVVLILDVANIIAGRKTARSELS